MLPEAIYVLPPVLLFLASCPTCDQTAESHRVKGIPVFTQRVEKCEILPHFSSPLTFQVLLFKNGGNQKSETLVYYTDVWALICCRPCVARAPQLEIHLPSWGPKSATVGKTVTSLWLSHTWTDCVQVQISQDGTLWLQESCRIVKTH